MAISQVNSQIDMSHSASVIEKQKNDLSSGNLDSKEEIKKLSEQFESIFLGIVLKSMRKSVPDSGLVKKGNGEEIFRSMLDTEYSKSLAAQRTTGLAKSIENHLLGLMPQSQASTTVVNKLNGLQHYQKER